MDRKNLFILFSTIILLLLIAIISYSSYYNSIEEKKLKVENIEMSNKLEPIDLLSKLDFFKILVEDTDSNSELNYSEKVVTIRDINIIKDFNSLLKSAKINDSLDFTDYVAPISIIGYLDDNTICHLDIVDEYTFTLYSSNLDKVFYSLDKDTKIKTFLSNLYNTNVNFYTYSVVEEAGKFGISYNHKTIINPVYDNITIIDDRIDVFAVTLDGTTFFIDKFQENPFPDLSYVELIPSISGESSSNKNALIFKDNEKFGLISLEGLTILDAEYDKSYVLDYIQN